MRKYLITPCLSCVPARKFFILFFVFYNLYFVFLSSAQTTYFNNLYNVPENFWEKGGNVTEIENEGYIFTGVTAPLSNIKQSLLILKTDINGNVLWVKMYGDSGEYYYDNYSSLVKTQDGNYAFGGSYETTTSGAALLVKFDKNGDTLWTKKYGNLNDREIAYKCRQTKEGGFVLIGFREKNNGSVLPDVYLVKTDSQGVLQWEKTYGWTGVDVGSTVQQTDDGGYIIGGYTDKSGEGVYVIKTDSLGIQQWYKVIGINISGGGGGVYLSQDGGYLVATFKDNLDGLGEQGYLAKLDSAGNILWEKTYGGGGDQWLEHILVLNDGSIVAMGAGFFNSGNTLGWLMKTDSNGKILWSRNYYTRKDIDNYFWGIDFTKDSDFVITGAAWDSTQDMWMLKVDSCGWGVGNSQPEANFIVDSINITNFTVFLQNTSKNACRYKWFFGDGDSAVAINTSHAFIDTGMKIITLIAYAGNESDTLRDTILINLPKECLGSKIEVYPNPFKNTTLINYILTNEAYIIIELYNLLGKKVFTMINGIQDIGCYKYDLNPAEIGLLPGIYLLKYSANEKTEIRKLIILRQE